MAQAMPGRSANRLNSAGLLAMDLRAGSAECFYSTAPAFRGRGVAPSALEALTSWAFSAGFHRLYLRHSVANPASCRVAVKSGFAAEGTERGAELHTDGWHDLHLHARIAGRQ
jgi:RimJ/RimL family protein N-acetyltransferase